MNYVEKTIPDVGSHVAKWLYLLSRCCIKFNEKSPTIKFGPSHPCSKNIFCSLKLLELKMILTVLSFARAFFRHTNTKTFKIRDGPLEDDGPHCLPFPFK